MAWHAFPAPAPMAMFESTIVATTPVGAPDTDQMVPEPHSNLSMALKKTSFEGTVVFGATETYVWVGPKYELVLAMDMSMPEVPAHVVAEHSIEFEETMLSTYASVTVINSAFGGGLIR